MHWQYTKWEERYGKSVAEQLEAWFNEKEATHDYMDSLRVARIDHAHEQAEYATIKDNGCCGEVDEEIEISGMKYNVGFNWGH